MIIKSFIRKKTTIIYIIVITLIFTTITILDILIKKLENINTQNYIETSLLYVGSQKDYLDSLKKDKDIKNIKQVLTFDYFDSLKNLSHSMITLMDLEGKVLVYSQDNNTLKDNEVIIGLYNGSYKSVKPRIDELIGKEITFMYQGEFITLKIKEIINTNRRSTIFISKNLFNEIQNDYYAYVSNIVDEKKENVVINRYRKDDNLVKFLSDVSELDKITREKTQDLISNLNIASYIIIVLFTIILIVIDKNIIADLKESLKLEYQLGFRKWQRKLNVIKRLTAVHILSIFIVFMIMIIVIMKSKISLNFKELISLYIIPIILLSDLLLSLIADNKSKMKS